MEQLSKKATGRRGKEKSASGNYRKIQKILENFHTILGDTPDTMLLLSTDMKVLWRNHDTALKEGINIMESSEHTCYGQLYNLSTPCDKCPAIKSFQTGKAEIATILAPDNKLRNTRAFPVKSDKDGSIRNVIVIASEIMKETSLETMVMHTSHLVSLGELAAGVAHEINNPINSIINYAQILLDEYDGEVKDSDIIQRIIKEGCGKDSVLLQ